MLRLRYNYCGNDEEGKVSYLVAYLLTVDKFGCKREDYDG